jgi:hypothetical protein
MARPQGARVQVLADLAALELAVFNFIASSLDAVTDGWPVAMRRHILLVLIHVSAARRATAESSAGLSLACEHLARADGFLAAVLDGWIKCGGQIDMQIHALMKACADCYVAAWDADVDRNDGYPWEAPVAAE